MRRIALVLYLSRRLIFGALVTLILLAIVTILLMNQKFEVTAVELQAINYKAEYSFTDQQFMKALQRILDENKYQSSQMLKRPLYKLIVKRRLGTRVYFLDNAKQIYKVNKKISLNSQVGDKISIIIERLEEVSPYGKILPWERVNELFPKYARAIVRDVETGLGFKVQRRAGSKHADVQPLSKEDTAIFKAIYGGKWSWRRRAVVVEIDGLKIAASMNGMPHGAGAISGNNFPGHSCLHFMGTRVHGSNKVDLAHQIMVWKSAGKFDEFLSVQEAEKLPEILFAVLNQLDQTLLTALVLNDNQQEKLTNLMKETSKITVESCKQVGDGKERKIYRGLVKILNLKQSERLEYFSVTIVKNKDYEGWIIESVELTKKKALTNQ